MEMRQAILLIRKWLWLILLATFLGGGSAYLFSTLVAPTYQATTLLQIDQGIDPRVDTYSAVLTSERTAKTYVETLKSPSLLKEVIRYLELGMSTPELEKLISAEQIRDTQIIRVSVEHPSPYLARDIANTLAQELIIQNFARQQARFEEGAAELEERIVQLESRMEDTQIRIAELQAREEEIRTAYLQTQGEAPQTGINEQEGEQENNTAPITREDSLRLQPLSRAERLELARLQGELTRDQTLYVILLNSAEDFHLATARYADNISVLSPAEASLQPVRPSILLNTLLGLISGLVLGVSLSFFLEHMDDTLKSPEQVQTLLQLPTMGQVGVFKGLKRPSDRLVTLKDSRWAEAYRVLRTNLQFARAGSPLESIVVTSSNPLEGKSTTAANLAIAVAQAGKKVILVDADLRRPSLHEFFGARREPGLTDLLVHGWRSGIALQDSGIPGLSLIASGTQAPNPTELLGSDQMSDLISTLQRQADLLIFDSPPVLPAADASLLATKVGGVLFVLVAGKTTRAVTQRAVEALRQVEARILGVVINRQKTVWEKGYYYYYSRAATKTGREIETQRGVTG